MRDIRQDIDWAMNFTWQELEDFLLTQNKDDLAHTLTNIFRGC